MSDAEGCQKLREALQNELASLLQNGFLHDLVETQINNLASPAAVAPWRELPHKLYRSESLTRILKKQLDMIVPGTSASYNQVLAAVMKQTHTASFCYLVGGHIRDLLRGKVGVDIDFNYACTAQDVAMVCVKNMWAVKFKAIGPVSEPNYVLIGDESTDSYMEGFSLSFNALAECCTGDFRQNMLFYDCTNHVIIDKSGNGVEDIRTCALRMACAPAQNFEDWASSDITYGLKSLRYVKFIIRSKEEGVQAQTDAAEMTFVVSSLRKAFSENQPALAGFWFGYALGGALASQEGVSNLREWVVENGGPDWWQEWLPFVRPKVADQCWIEERRPSMHMIDAAEKAISNSRPVSRLSNSRPVSRPGSALRISKDCLYSGAEDPVQKFVAGIDTKEVIKGYFRQIDIRSDGFISYGQLKTVMRMIDPSWTDGQFDVVVKEMLSPDHERLKYEDFVDSVFGA